MIFHVVTQNGIAQWSSPSKNYFYAKKIAQNLNSYRNYGIFYYSVKSFWSHKKAMEFIDYEN